MVLGAGRLAAGANDKEGEAKGQEHQHLFHDAAPVCSSQKQWEKTKRKGRCQCRARCEGQGQNYGCRFHGSPPFSALLSLPDHGKDIGDRHHVLELLSAFPPKADIGSACWDVRFVPDSDSPHCNQNGLFDHLVGEGKNVGRNLQAESLAVLRLPCTSKSGFIWGIPVRINRGHEELDHIGWRGTADEDNGIAARCFGFHARSDLRSRRCPGAGGRPGWCTSPIGAKRRRSTTRLPDRYR